MKMNLCVFIYNSRNVKKHNLYTVIHCTYLNDAPSLASVFSYG